jgi:hypothetical protein
MESVMGDRGTHGQDRKIGPVQIAREIENASEVVRLAFTFGKPEGVERQIASEHATGDAAFSCQPLDSARPGSQDEKRVEFPRVAPRDARPPVDVFTAAR